MILRDFALLLPLVFLSFSSSFLQCCTDHSHKSTSVLMSLSWKKECYQECYWVSLLSTLLQVLTQINNVILWSKDVDRHRSPRVSQSSVHCWMQRLQRFVLLMSLAFSSKKKGSLWRYPPHSNSLPIPSWFAFLAKIGKSVYQLKTFNILFTTWKIRKLAFLSPPKKTKTNQMWSWTVTWF